ncbi:hypothetical protein [Halorarius litoreus]|uniref:hypothetical protein n=1 Tax=Halorarius litoreus TaxID=2962676 RepID=UPI0020CF483A|nr:hypothetical protein [Halorarius litoreus]
MESDFDAALGALSHPVRLGLGVVVGVALGTLLGVATDNFALWLPAFLGVGVAIGVVLATQE